MVKVVWVGRMALHGHCRSPIMGQPDSNKGSYQKCQFLIVTLLAACHMGFVRCPYSNAVLMKVHYGSNATERRKDYDYNAHQKAQSDEVDRILEKLKKSGYDSLTTEEKKSLFDASKR